MSLSPWSVAGRRVAWPDIFLVLSVSTESYKLWDLFLEANRARIHEDGTTTKLNRHDRDGTLDPATCAGTIILSLSDPPGQSRSMFVIGRDPECADIICANGPVSGRHIMLGFEGNRVVLYDVSRLGSSLALGCRDPQRTFPKKDAPYKCILPLGCSITLTIPGYEFVFELAVRNGSELDLFNRNRDAFLAGCSRADFEALSLFPSVPTRLTTPSPRASEWRPMYWFDSWLGEGGFGTVHKVYRLQDWSVFAAKEVVRDSENGEKESLEREMKALQRLRHPRIVEYVDWYQEAEGNNILVMEYCQLGSLYHLMATASAPLPAREAANVLRQVAEGLLYLHGQGVTHRDLKPGNILVRSQQPLSLALADFGLAKMDDETMLTDCGTALYKAPEIWSGNKYTKVVDIWALGVVGLALLETELLWSKAVLRVGGPRLVSDKAAAMYHERPEDQFVAIIRKMLSWNPDDRPSAAECLNDASKLMESLQQDKSPAREYSPHGGQGTALHSPIRTSRQVTEDTSHLPANVTGVRPAVEVTVCRPTKDISVHPAEDVTVYRPTSSTGVRPADDPTVCRPMEDTSVHPAEKTSVRRPAKDISVRPVEGISILTSKESSGGAASDDVPTATRQQPGRKRGTDTRPRSRSGSMEAPTPKKARCTEEIRPSQDESSNVSPRPRKTLASKRRRKH